jgi:hypothetical protein
MLSPLPKHLALAAASLLTLLAPSIAAANYEDQPIPVPLRAAPDDLSGHFILAPKLAYLVPMGSAEQRFPQRAYTGAGPSFGLDLAYGISRYVALHGRFDYGMFADNDNCPNSGTCEATSIALGAGVDYHLVNGAAFDPWMRAGIGYRSMRYDLQWEGHKNERRYAGIDWLHLAVGGDWYPHSMIGFGPYLSLDVGTYGSRPDTPPPGTSGEVDSATHTFFSLGLRGVFDPMR